MVQANLGIQIGGTLTGGSLAKAQVYGQVPATLQFFAKATAGLDEGANSKGKYLVGVYLYYNAIFGAVANILGLTSWASGDRQAYTPYPRYTIFEKSDSFSSSMSTKRSLGEPYDIQYPRRGLLDALHISTPTGLDQNQSWGMSAAALLGRRQGSPSSDIDATVPDFSVAQQLTCPPGDLSQVTLPDYRRKSVVSLARIGQLTRM